MLPAHLAHSLCCRPPHTVRPPLQMKALVEMEGSGLVAMLEGDKYEDLSRMYALLKRVVDGGLGLMRQVR